MNRHFGDPSLLGRYPEELAEVYGAGWPQFADGEVAALRREIDFLGLNYYTRGVVREGAGYPTGAVKVHQRASTYTETDWEVHPESLRDTLLWLHGRYGELPLYVTENGAAFYDPPRAAEGRIDDPLRVAYFRSHLRAVLEARTAGADVRGYFAWSLLDNLEWSLGFSKRFGIVHVDFETLERTPKASAIFLRQVIASRGAALW
jgi:beta-glucosidase